MAHKEYCKSETKARSKGQPQLLKLVVEIYSRIHYHDISIFLSQNCKSPRSDPPISGLFVRGIEEEVSESH